MSLNHQGKHSSLGLRPLKGFLSQQGTLFKALNLNAYLASGTTKMKKLLRMWCQPSGHRQNQPTQTLIVCLLKNTLVFIVLKILGAMPLRPTPLSSRHINDDLPHEKANTKNGIGGHAWLHRGGQHGQHSAHLRQRTKSSTLG